MHYTDIASGAQTILDTDDDKVKYLDIRPSKRYIKLLVLRATQNATVGCVIALLYNPRSRPVTHGSNVAGEMFIFQPEGVA